MLLNVDNYEINRLLTTILHKSEKFINESGYWIIKNNFIEWEIEIFGYQKFNGLCFVNKNIVYDAIDEVLTNYQLKDFIKLDEDFSKTGLRLNIKYYGLTDTEFNKYLTLCKLYNLC